MTHSATTPWIDHIRQHAQRALRPLVDQIDRQGLYPESYLRELGGLGGFASLGGSAQGGTEAGLGVQVQVLQAVGAVCGATAFIAWCQSACALYLRETAHAAVRAKYLPAVLRAEQLAGTGMSNTVKHLAGIEKHLLTAQRVQGGYRIQGALPWVSNLADDAVFAATGQLPDGGHVMFMAAAHTPGVSFKPCPEFCALEGTRTVSVRFDEMFIADDEVLAHPDEFTGYIQRIKPGFILLQAGMAAGVIEGCLHSIRDSNLATPEANSYLDDSYAELTVELLSLQARTQRAASAVELGHGDMREVLQVRLELAELALRAAQSAALHAGAKGFLMRHAAQRRSREAMFVAIVTPAIKHLRRELALLGQSARVAAVHTAYGPRTAVSEQPAAVPVH